MIELARDTLAAAVDGMDAGAELGAITAYREPPRELVLPAFVVLDPDRIEYVQSRGGVETIEVRARLVVPATHDDESARALDRLLAPDQLPARIRSHNTAVWRRAAVLRTTGAYSTYVTADDKRRPLGLSVELAIHLTFPT